jgi:hypothetical protein
MVEQIHERYEQYPKDVLVNGGFVKHAVCASLHMMPADIDIVSALEKDCTVYGPVRQPQDASTDRYAPRATDSAAVAAWRQRMASAEAQAIYKDRAATVECVNALARNRGLRQQTSVSSAAKAGGIREVSAEDEKTNFFTNPVTRLPSSRAPLSSDARNLTSPVGPHRYGSEGYGKARYRSP